MSLALAHDESESEMAGQDGSGLIVQDGRTIPARFHPLAQLFPMIEGEAFAALVEDVRANGVRRPVVMFEGMILDGRNRYMAAREAEVGYPVVEFTGSDPVAFVISENIHRRHLTESQRAVVAARLAKLPRGGDGSNQHQSKTADLRISSTTAQAAEQLNVSPRMVEAARSVVRDGAPELVAMVEAGEATVSAAAAVAKLPELEQVAIVEQGPAAVREAAKTARQERAAKPELEKKPKSTGLTLGALEEENAALKEQTATLRAKLEKSEAERKRVKALLDDLKSDDSGAVIRRLNGQIEHMRSQMFRTEEALSAEKRRSFKLNKRVEELENMPINMEAA